MSKIKGSDSVQDVFISMAEGNPGAITAMMELIENAKRIDPQAMIGAISPILYLDTCEIYGSSIYVLWSDKCGKDVRKLIMLLRATQLGFLPTEKLQEMAADQCYQVTLSDDEMAELDAKVCAELEHFEKAA